MVRMFIESGYDGELEYNSTLNRFYPPKYPATLALAMKTEFRIDLNCNGDLNPVYGLILPLVRYHSSDSYDASFG
jgi:hypothetical protein